MTSIERFYKTVNREPVDRPAAWLGMPDVLSQPQLLAYYGVKDMHELKLAVGDDFYSVEVPYQSLTANAIYAAFDWYMNGSDVDEHDRTLTTPGCFEDAEDLEDLAFFNWPNPELYIDKEECAKRVAMAPEDKVKLGICWSSHFQDTCAAFGMETALMNMLANPEIYQAVDDKVVEFYLKANKIFYEATKGKLNAVLIGNDMGSQRGLMLSPECVRKFIIPGTKKLIDQAHEYGLKVIYHSCGSIVDIIPDLIEAGVDIIHPIQALAAGMEPQSLKEKFADKVCFCGGVDTQDLLVNGTPEDVRAKVEELRMLFPTGLILSPSHEAIMPDVPPANIKALFDAAQMVHQTVTRYAGVIDVKPEHLKDYVYHHQHPWAEVNEIIKACNLSNYSIYYHDGKLFSYYEYTGSDYEADMEKMAQYEVIQKWWDLVKPYMQPLATRKSGEFWANMEEVFYLA